MCNWFLILFSLTTVYGADICDAPPRTPRSAFDDGAYKAEISTLIGSNKELKMCRYRDEGLFPNPVWRWRTGGACYCYSIPTWFKDKINTRWYKMTIEGVDYTFPIGTVAKNLLIFDYLNETYVEIIKSSFKDDVFFTKWMNCVRNADRCCNDTMDEENVYSNDESLCPALWDGWSCFLQSKINSVVEIECPDYTTSSNDVPCALYSRKECFANGTWNRQTEYGTCASAPVYRRRHKFHVIVLYVSIALSLPAVIIFTAYRNLRILRVNLHRNLLIACIVKNIFTIMTKEIVILDSLKAPSETNGVLNENGVPCRILAYFNNVAANAVYACMLMDGFYLHKLIVRIFTSDPNVYVMYATTAVLSFLPSTIWAIVLSVEANEHCWMVDTSWYQWIPDGFRIAILSINVLLLFDIIRALLSKLRKNVTAQHTKSTLKAMSFLIPLFGVPFILTADRHMIINNSCAANDAYYYASYSIQALQSVMVALLFCYWNKEVHAQIKTTYRKIKSAYEERYRGKTNDRELSIVRRETGATYVRNNSVDPTTNVLKSNSEDSSKRVNDWLTQNNVTTQSSPVNFIIANSNTEEADIFKGVHRFIDDSTDSLQKIEG